VTKVFISYRRGDAAGHAGRLADRLCASYGREQVFMDLDSIGPGADFVARIRQAVGSCDAALVLIGNEWLSARDEQGRRRLDDPNDFVRLEVAEALKRDGVAVIPVLVEGAEMPKPQELPEDIRDLSRRNAIQLSDERWNYDVERLQQAVGQPQQPLRGRLPRVPMWAVLTAAALAGIVAVAAVVSAGGDSVDLKEGAYRGTLNTGAPVAFDVGDGEVRDIEFAVAAVCRSDQGLPDTQSVIPFQALPTTKGEVGSDGTFGIDVDFPEQTFRMEGEIAEDGNAEGSLRWTYGADLNGNGPVGDAPYSCDTGPLAWTAQG
jgi:TIR domain